MPTKYAAILRAVKMIIFRFKFFDILLIFAQNIDHGFHLPTNYFLEQKYNPVNPSFTI